jgi:hypothetical protein
MHGDDQNAEQHNEDRETVQRREGGEQGTECGHEKQELPEPEVQ